MHDTLLGQSAPSHTRPPAIRRPCSHGLTARAYFLSSLTSQSLKTLPPWGADGGVGKVLAGRRARQRLQGGLQRQAKRNQAQTHPVAQPDLPLSDGSGALPEPVVPKSCIQAHARGLAGIEMQAAPQGFDVPREVGLKSHDREIGANRDA